MNNITLNDIRKIIKEELVETKNDISEMKKDIKNVHETIDELYEKTVESFVIVIDALNKLTYRVDANEELLDQHDLSIDKHQEMLNKLILDHSTK